MAEVNLTINGRTYGISCDDGQERRVQQLGQLIDSRLKEISKAGAASNELHLLVLTALMIADETLELREENTALNRQMTHLAQTIRESGDSRSDEDEIDETAIAQAIDQLASRIDTISGRLQKV